MVSFPCRLIRLFVFDGVLSMSAESHHFVRQEGARAEPTRGQRKPGSDLSMISAATQAPSALEQVASSWAEPP